jgi:hypothetical protein
MVILMTVKKWTKKMKMILKKWWNLLQKKMVEAMTKVKLKKFKVKSSKINPMTWRSMWMIVKKLNLMKTMMKFEPLKITTVKHNKWNNNKCNKSSSNINKLHRCNKNRTMLKMMMMMLMMIRKYQVLTTPRIMQI